MIQRRTWRRVHQEDMCQALGLHPSQKYQSDGGPSPDKIADLLRVSMPPRAASSAVEAFVDALAFNWLVAAPDAHAKNYALLLRSEEHTSELQSLMRISYAVFCLKKKKN